MAALHLRPENLAPLIQGALPGRKSRGTPRQKPEQRWHTKHTSNTTPWRPMIVFQDANNPRQTPTSTSVVPKRGGGANKPSERNRPNENRPDENRPNENRLKEEIVPSDRGKKTVRMKTVRMKTVRKKKPCQVIVGRKEINCSDGYDGCDAARRKDDIPCYPMLSSAVIVFWN
jgi:hypothetical protein